LIAGTVEGRRSAQAGRRQTATARGFISDGSRGLMIAGRAGRAGFGASRRMFKRQARDTIPDESRRLVGRQSRRMRHSTRVGSRSKGEAGGCDTGESRRLARRQSWRPRHLAQVRGQPESEAGKHNADEESEVGSKARPEDFRSRRESEAGSEARSRRANIRKLLEVGRWHR